MIRFFRTSPPSVHQMVLSLETAGLMSRNASFDPHPTSEKSCSWLAANQICSASAGKLLANAGDFSERPLVAKI
jgi:hypothetical protein